MASGTIGSINIHVWNGPAPPAVKSVVDLVYRPGQATAAAKVLPTQSTESQFEAVTFIEAASAHTTADTFRSLIGTSVALTYHGVSYGNVLVKDVTILEVVALLRAHGRHPAGTAFNFAPAGRITSRWQIVRLA